MSNPNPKTDQLRPFNKMSKEEFEAIHKKGVEATKKACKEKADTRKLINLLLDQKVTDATNKKILDSLGVEDNERNNRMLLICRAFKKAMRGDVKAMNLLLKDFEMSQVDRETIKINKQRLKLEKEKLNLQKEKNELLKKEIEAMKNSGKNNGVIIVNDLDELEDLEDPQTEIKHDQDSQTE